MTTLQTNELKHRVQARKLQLEARLEQLKADAASKQSDTAKQIRKKLHELEESMRGGWDNMKEATVERLNSWLRSD